MVVYIYEFSLQSMKAMQFNTTFRRLSDHPSYIILCWSDCTCVVFVGSLFCCVVLGVASSLAIILLRERELNVSL